MITSDSLQYCIHLKIKWQTLNYFATNEWIIQVEICLLLLRNYKVYQIIYKYVKIAQKSLWQALKLYN